MCQCYGIFRSRKKEDAYELANGKISKSADAIESDIESIKNCKSGCRCTETETDICIP